jgi:hypothetical protein
MRRTAFKSKVSHKKLLQFGKRAKKCAQIYREVTNPELRRLDINYCEFKGYEPGDCHGPLFHCHAKKRSAGRIVTDEDWADSALGCQGHGERLDDRRLYTPGGMAEAVHRAIIRRESIIPGI